ncbi:MAG: beta-galactosidase [Acidobacteriota bacterium]|nr:MAG: beta-galactosidase [Acidobacteriota bacterium]
MSFRPVVLFRSAAFAFFLLLSCPSILAFAEPDVFATFELAEEVNRLEHSEGVQLKSSERFPAFGKNSLEVVFPEAGGRVRLESVPADWRWQGSLLFFVWSDEENALRVILQDQESHQFSRDFALQRGANHVQLPLSEVNGLELGAMEAVVLESSAAQTVFLDYFALDRFHPVLVERGRWDVNYSNQVVTDHFPWGRELKTGTIRAFAIADVANGRGVIELAQRLELTPKAVTLGRSPGINKWGFGDFYEQRSGGGEFWADPYSLIHTYIASDLLYGPDYDVILWPGLHPWESFPGEIRDEIRRRVENGAGLVFFYPVTQDSEAGGLRDLSPLVIEKALGGEFGMTTPVLDESRWAAGKDHYITRGIPFEAFPWGQIGVVESDVQGEILLKTEEGTPVLATRQVGKGRVVAFAYPEKGMIPQIDKVFETGLHYPYHEYMWSLVARSVVWAASREPVEAIVQVEQNGDEVVVEFSGVTDGATVEATVGSDFGEREAQLSIQVPAGAERVNLAVPKDLGKGRHFVNLRLIRDGATLDWAGAEVNLESDVRIAGIEEIPEQIQVGERVSGKLRLSASRSTEAEVTVRLYDNYDRLVDQNIQEVQVDEETALTISLNSTGALSHIARIDCEVKVGGRRSDRKTSEIFVIQPRKWDDYDIVMYRFGPDPIPGIWPAIDQQMRRLHVTTLSSYSLSHSKHANYNIQAQTRISGQESPDGPARNYYVAMKKEYANSRNKRGLVREFCMNDPAYHELVKKEIREKAGEWAPLSPLSYYVYEEPSLTCYADDLDLCFSDHCMTKMRGWLKAEYNGLDELNRRWGTDFERWDDVMPDDTYEAQARGNYASWTDHRTFMEKTYAGFFAFVLDELRKIDPEGMLLNSGTQVSGAHNGCDYSQINNYTRHLNAYEGGNQLDFHRSFNPDIKMSSGAGYGVLGKNVFYDFYSNLFKGSNGGAYIFWQYSTLDPDLSMSQSGLDMEEGFGELRGRGIGKLVGLAQPDNHGIAVHYSYPSIHAAWIVDGTIEERVVYRASSKTLRAFNDNRDGWVKILKDSGLQFDFISYGDVEQGKLISKGYNTLVLPMSLALSDEEIVAIREFVSQGGTVIADALPGVMDEHSVFRSDRQIKQLLGIEARPVSTETVVAMEGEPAVELRGAEALAQAGKKPILLRHRVGEGQAFLLNFFLDGYPEDKLEGRERPALERMKIVLDAAGIGPKVNLRTVEDEPVAGCARYLFDQGTTQLYGLVPDKERQGSPQVRIGLETGKTIYDVRRSRYLTTADSFTVEIEPAVPELFAFVDGRVEEIQLESPDAAQLGEEVTVSLRVLGIDQYRSVGTAVVVDPRGREIPLYGGNLDIVDGTGRLSFRTALNDPAGSWTIRVKDTVSGVEGVTSISVSN